MKQLLDFVTTKGIVTNQDAEQLTALELIYLIIEKLNDCVITVNELMEAGVEQAVIDQLTLWKDNGTLSDLISQEILDDIKGKLESRVVYLQDYPKLTSDASDSERLQRAIEQAQLLGKVVKLENKNYQCLKPLQLDISKTSLDGNGATLDFSSMDTTLFSGCLKVIATDNPPYHQNHKAFIKDLEMVGNREGLDGIILGHNQAGVGVAHIDLDKLNIQNCKDGIVTGEHTYLIRMNSVDIFNCEICLNIKFKDDSGENMILDGCALYNSTTCLQVNNPNTSVNLINTSMDYSTTSIHCIQGNIKATQCHIEGCGQLIIEDNSGADVVLSGCTLVMVSKAFPPYVVKGRGRLVVKDGFITGGNYDGVHKDVVSGGGYVKFINNNSYDICDHFMQYYSDTDELMKLVAIGEGASTDVWTNNNCKITIDGEKAETNNFCYKIAKTYGAGSQSGVLVYIPITTHRVAIRVRVKADEQINVPVEIFYARTIEHQPESQANVYSLSRSQTIGDTTHTIGTEWQWLYITTNSMRKPEWCNAILLKFNFFTLNQPVIYIDRVNVNTY